MRVAHWAERAVDESSEPGRRSVRQVSAWTGDGMAGRLAGKVALVSGGARGMGASHVRCMVAEGAKVVFGDILDEEGELVAKEVGDDTRYIHLDVTPPDDWDAAVAFT